MINGGWRIERVDLFTHVGGQANIFADYDASKA